MTNDRPLHGKRVLVLEDDYYLATDAQALLEGAGARVVGPFGRTCREADIPDAAALDAAIVDINLGRGPSFDFARLLVNPKGYAYTGTVRGIAVDTAAGRPLAGVLVSAGNVVQALTDDKGGFLLEKVPAGLVVTTGSKPGMPASTGETWVLAAAPNAVAAPLNSLAALTT